MTTSNAPSSTSAGTFTAPSLVIATGALSFPKLGATPFGYEIADQFNVKRITPRPGLVPFTWGPSERERFVDLSGLSLDCVANAGPDAPSFRENLLFTHRGLSGPAILQISSHWHAGETIRLDVLPGVSALDLFAAHKTGGREGNHRGGRGDQGSAAKGHKNAPRFKGWD